MCRLGRGASNKDSSACTSPRRGTVFGSPTGERPWEEGPLVNDRGDFGIDIWYGPSLTELGPPHADEAVLVVGERRSGM